MDILYKKIKELPPIAPPANLHRRLMRVLYFERYRHGLVLIMACLAVTLILLIQHIVMRIVDMESFSFLQDMLAGFEWSFDFGEDYVSALVQSLPLFSLGITIINCVALGYLINLGIRLNGLRLRFAS